MECLMRWTRDVSGERSRNSFFTAYNSLVDRRLDGAANCNRSRGGGLAFALAVALLPVLVSYAQAQPERIRGAIDSNQTVELMGHISPRLRVARDDGAVPDGFPIGPVTMVLSRSVAQQAELEA